MTGDWTFHHLGLACSDLDAERLHWQALGYRQEGETWISIDDGPLNWVIFFYSCEADVCGDIQYAASFSNPGISQAMINDWNRDQRFLKAYFIPAADGRDNTGVVQYDVLIQSPDVEQLTDHTALWLDLLAAFGTTVGYLAAAE